MANLWGLPSDIYILMTFHVVILCYRFSVKLAIDKTLFGLNEEEDHMELYKQTKELMNDWFVGPDNLKAWNFAIEQEIPNLFSLGYNSFNVSEVLVI